MNQAVKFHDPLDYVQPSPSGGSLPNYHDVCLTILYGIAI